MKPLNIPRIRALDLTERYWHRRKAWRVISARLIKSLVMPKMGRIDPVARFPDDATVTFRRPAPFAIPQADRP